jgi:monofunctional glycosyltransferase
MKAFVRLIGLLLLAGLGLQIYFAARVAAMAFVNPESSAFERSEMARIVREKHRLAWRQQWVAYADISDHLKRAVIASEDSGFVDHEGIDVEAMEKAWEKNARSGPQRLPPAASKLAPGRAAGSARSARPAKIVGGSTITQQLAKNLFLSGERTLLRKGQELVLAVMLEKLLGKERILEIYLNSVELGEGVFGVEAAAQHYYRKSAARVGPYEAARLAVMLPRPRYFETRPQSGYLASRAATIAARMGGVELP